MKVMIVKCLETETTVMTTENTIQIVDEDLQNDAMTIEETDKVLRSVDDTMTQETIEEIRDMKTATRETIEEIRIGESVAIREIGRHSTIAEVEVEVEALNSEDRITKKTMMETTSGASEM